MSDSLALHDTLFAAVRKANPVEDPRRQRVFLWLVVGLLWEKTVSLSALALVIVSPAHAASRVRRLRLETDVATFTLGRDRVRWILTPNRGGLLNSSKFDVRLERDGTRVTAIVAEGGGWGHGIGMCQVGAMGRARAGQDYRTILGTYYPGTELRELY